MGNARFGFGLRCCAAFAFAFGLVKPALADETGAFELGFRLGYATSFGNQGQSSPVTSDTALSAVVAGHVPLLVDIGYQPMPSIFFGAYAQYGIGITGADFEATCEEPESWQRSCHSRAHRVGGQLHYRFAPAAPYSPWLGLGGGYEWVIAAADGYLDTLAHEPRVPARREVTMSGPEFVNLQAGVDSTTTGALLGGFASVTLARFDEFAFSCFNTDCSREPHGGTSDGALHGWASFGVRAVLPP